MTGLRLALGLALLAAAMGCEAPPTAEDEETRQAIAELRVEVAALKRTVARLEQELDDVTASGQAAAPTVEAARAESQAPARARCKGTTASGERCRRAVSNGAGFCWQHAAP